MFLRKSIFTFVLCQWLWKILFTQKIWKFRSSTKIKLRKKFTTHNRIDFNTRIKIVETRNFGNLEQREQEIMTFLISFLQLKFLHSSDDSFHFFDKLFFVFSALGIKCICRVYSWMCDGIFCWVAAFYLAFIPDLKGKKFVFYVFMLRNFIVFNNHLEEILFHISLGQQFPRENN
jgi:hypothetical protein